MITVIGGSGFIGTWLCQNLADRGVPFEIVDLEKSRRFPEKTKVADIRDHAAISVAIEGEIVINLAAVHRDDVRDPSAYYETNVEGTRNICRVAVDKGIKQIVFTSTVAVYGFCKPGTSENGVVKPFNDYGRSKYEGEEILRAWFEGAPDKRHLTIVRPTVVFGEGNRGNVYNLLKQISSGRFMMIGSGRNQKSMAYVGNVAAFLAAALRMDDGYRLYNYVDKPDLDMNTLVSIVRGTLHDNSCVGPRLPYWLGLILGYSADLVAAVTGKSLPVSLIRVKKFCATTTFTTQMEQMGGFCAPYELKEGILRTVNAEFMTPHRDLEKFFTE